MERGGVCRERGESDAHARRQAAARAELGDGGGGSESVSTRPGAARLGVVRPRPRPPSRLPACHGQRGQPRGRRWRRAVASGRPWPRPWPGPRRREAAFSTSRRWTAPRGGRGAGDRGTTGPWPWPWSRSRSRSGLRQVSARLGARGAGSCCLRLV